MKTWTFEELYRPLSEEMLKKLSTRRLYNYYKKWRSMDYSDIHYYKTMACSDSYDVVQQKIEDHRKSIKKILGTLEHLKRVKR